MRTEPQTFPRATQVQADMPADADMTAAALAVATIEGPAGAEAQTIAEPATVDVKGQQALRALAAAMALPVAESLTGRVASADFVRQIPIGFARQHRCMGLVSEDGADTLEVAVSHVAGLDQVDVLTRMLRRPVQVIVAPESEILAAINLAYQQRTGQAEAFIQHLDREQVLEQVKDLDTRDDLLDVSSRAPVIQLVNLILFEAVKSLASDVHIQPYEDNLVVRIRIDGVLFDAYKLPKGLQDEVISRIKVMARMNIAEKRLAQDGRATVQVGDRLIDLRVASLPTSHGERVVIRLLDKSARLYTLNELGMPMDTLRRFRELIHVEHGLILVTGPTGSGKSTTLYGSLQELNSTALNILTLEDPIEYQLPGISQTQISTRKGMTFASGLRSVLRQDPDIIMVGEIRDHETAVMAIQSALTGHLVFSTLHTNDAASAVTRLLDLGIEPYLVASSLVGVLAQRLVRRNCQACEVPHRPTDEALGRIDLRGDVVGPDATMRRGLGCDACRQTGYSGRVGVFELLVVHDAVRRRIQDRSTAADVKQVAMEAGMTTLRQAGARKVLEGVTTVDEVIRVTARATQ